MNEDKMRAEMREVADAALAMVGAMQRFADVTGMPMRGVSLLLAFAAVTMRGKVADVVPLHGVRAAVPATPPRERAPCTCPIAGNPYQAPELHAPSCPWRYPSD